MTEQEKRSILLDQLHGSSCLCHSPKPARVLHPRREARSSSDWTSKERFESTINQQVCFQITTSHDSYKDRSNHRHHRIGVIDEAAVEGESGSGEKFYDAEDKEQDSPDVNEEIPAAVSQSSAQQKKQDASGVDPSCPTGRIPEVVMTKLQAEFERKRANRFLADLEKSKAENARLLALLHQAQSKPNP
ncbi:hypothetical protein Dimus_001095 [Dionaea muscipula]